MDSNHDKELQRLLCYHYTTGQTAVTLALCSPPGKGKVVSKSYPQAVVTEKPRVPRALQMKRAFPRVSAHLRCNASRKPVFRDYGSVVLRFPFETVKSSSAAIGVCKHLWRALFRIATFSYLVWLCFSLLFESRSEVFHSIFGETMVLVGDLGGTWLCRGVQPKRERHSVGRDPRSSSRSAAGRTDAGPAEAPDDEDIHPVAGDGCRTRPYPGAADHRHDVSHCDG